MRTDEVTDIEVVMRTVDSQITALSSDGATLAKVIATFSVVLTHSYKLFKYMGLPESEVFFLKGFHAFGSCGVPVFFLLSGYFLVFKGHWDYIKNLKKKFRSLVIPYCIFILFYALISIIGSMVLPSFFDDFRKFTAYDWLMHLFGIPFVSSPIYYGPLWFLRDLFILNLASIALVPMAKKIPSYILIPLMIVVYCLPIQREVRYSIPFFISGIYFGFSRRIPIPAKTSFMVFLLFSGLLLPVVFKGDLSWYISVMLMVVFILTISERLIQKGVIARIALIAIPFSFPIYLLHEYPMTTLLRILAMKQISLSFAIAVFFLAPFLIIGFCIIIIFVWKRLLPRSYALFTGGRYLQGDNTK